jgi:hypothetical protein
MGVLGDRIHPSQQGSMDLAAAAFKLISGLWRCASCVRKLVRIK